MYESDKKALCDLLNKEELIVKLNAAIEKYKQSPRKFPQNFSLISIFNKSLPAALQCLGAIKAAKNPYDKLEAIKVFFNGHGGWTDISMKTLFLEQINGLAMKNIPTGLPMEDFRAMHVCTLIDYAEKKLIELKIKKSLPSEVELKVFQN